MTSLKSRFFCVAPARLLAGVIVRLYGRNFARKGEGILGLWISLYARNY